MEKLLKLFTFILNLIQILGQYPLWFKCLCAIWIVLGLALFTYFTLRYPHYSKPMGQKPKFVTDRTSNNEVFFTIANPKGSNQIRIVDLKLIKFEEEEFLAGSEDRFDLSQVDISKEHKNVDRTDLNMDLSASKSIFYDDKIIRIEEDDAASFRVKFYGNEHLSQCIFRLIAVYIDSAAEKGEIPSDNLYIASKWFGETAIKKIVGVAPQELISDLQKGHYTDLKLLKFFGESDFPDHNIFSFLIDVYKSGQCKEWEKFLLIKTIGHFTNSKVRKNDILSIIRSLDDIKDFGSKYYFIEVLVEKGDKRVMPYARSFIDNTRNLQEVPDPINVKGAIESLQKKLGRF